MTRYLAGRAVSAAVIVGVILVVNFVLTRILPGNPVDVLVGEFPAPPEYIARVRLEFGLDRPLLVQLWLYLVHLAQGDLGYSFANRQPVAGLILRHAGQTLLLMIPALTVASAAA